MAKDVTVNDEYIAKTKKKVMYFLITCPRIYPSIQFHTATSSSLHLVDQMTLFGSMRQVWCMEADVCLAFVNRITHSRSNLLQNFTFTIQKNDCD